MLIAQVFLYMLMVPCFLALMHSAGRSKKDRGDAAVLGLFTVIFTGHLMLRGEHLFPEAFLSSLLFGLAVMYLPTLVPALFALLLMPGLLLTEGVRAAVQRRGI